MIADGALDELLSVDLDAWRDEAESIREHFATFGEQLPPELAAQLDALESRLAAARFRG